MPKRRVTELLLYGTGPIAIFVTAPILARGLGPDGRGELGVAQAVASFALAIGALGQAEVLLADRRNGGGNLRVSGGIALVGGLVTSAAAGWWLLILGVEFHVALAAIILIPLLSQSQLWRSIAIANRKLNLPAMNSAAGAVLRVVFLLGLAMTAWLSPAMAMFAIQLSAGVAAVATLGLFASRKRQADLNVRSPGAFMSNIKRGTPLIAFSLLTSVTLRSDLIALQLFSDPASVGVYAAASSLSMAVLAISGAFKSRAQAAAFGGDARQGVRREVLIVAGVGVIGATAAVLLSPWIVDVLLGPGFESAVPLLRVLAVSCIGLLVLDSVHGLLAVLGQRKMMVLVAAVGATTRISSLVVLVPWLGVMGAALSTVLSFTVASIVGWIIVRNRMS